MQVKCTSCGATQELAANHQCGYCGSAIEQEKAQENYKSSTTGEVGNLMMMAETAVDATNWEEALQYYNKALEKDIANSDAWLAKGIAMVYTSKIGDIKTKEAIAYWKNAIKHAENNDAMGKRVAKEINTVVNTFYPAIENHYIEFNELDNSYKELVSRFDTLENALDYAMQLDKDEICYPETGYELCKRVIELPSRFASASKTAAQWGGALGQLTDNKYAAAQARRDSRDKVSAANRRLDEINKASLIVKEIRLKYLTSIKKINPTFIEDFIIATFKEKKDLNATYLAYFKEFDVSASTIPLSSFSNLATGAEINKISPEINKVLLEKGLITNEDIEKHKRQIRNVNIAMIVIFLIAIIVLVLVLVI